MKHSQKPFFSGKYKRSSLKNHFAKKLKGLFLLSIFGLPFSLQKILVSTRVFIPKLV